MLIIIIIMIIIPSWPPEVPAADLSPPDADASDAYSPLLIYGYCFVLCRGCSFVLGVMSSLILLFLTRMYGSCCWYVMVVSVLFRCYVIIISVVYLLVCCVGLV